MPSSSALIAFGTMALFMVLSPGPNMLYLVSRSLSQGAKAGLISLLGVACGFVIYLLLAIAGITAVVAAVPYALAVLRVFGVLYLLFLAWRTIRSESSPFTVSTGGREDSPRKLFLMGLLTNILNPKIALFYLAVLPQFMEVNSGSMLQQGLILGTLQICISLVVNGLIVLLSGRLGRFIEQRPTFFRVQRWILAGVLAGFAARLSFQGR